MTPSDLIAELATLSKAEKAEVVERLAQEIGDTWPGIEKTPGVCGGSACIVRTRISFIGSPAMNFLEATVSDNGRWAVLGRAVQVPLDGSGLPAWARKKVVLGVRPEHLELNGSQTGSIRLTVDHVELLGADTLVHGRFGDGRISLTARLPDVHRFEKHTTIGVSFPLAKLHLFDPETKKRI